MSRQEETAVSEKMTVHRIPIPVPKFKLGQPVNWRVEWVSSSGRKKEEITTHYVWSISLRCGESGYSVAYDIYEDPPAHNRSGGVGKVQNIRETDLVKMQEKQGDARERRPPG